MDEKELMMPLELGYVQVENKDISFFVTCEKSVKTVSECHVPYLNFIKHRWRRETRIKTVAGRPQGEVAYYAPCGKKLRQYPDVMKVPRPCSAAV